MTNQELLEPAIAKLSAENRALIYPNWLDEAI